MRPGTKFAVDYLLYKRGPVFAHAEFAVLVLPSYSHAYWKNKEGKGKGRGGQKSWWWLHSVNRVQAQVRKTLVVCWVEVPPPPPSSENGAVEDVGGLLRMYKVREMVLKRWTPNRSRD